MYTDEWAAYSGLTASSYTHHAVNHSIQFVDPTTGVQTNTQEGLWAHVKRSVVGSYDLESMLIDFMFKRRFHATGGPNQIANYWSCSFTSSSCMTDAVRLLKRRKHKRRERRRHPRCQQTNLRQETGDGINFASPHRVNNQKQDNYGNKPEELTK